MPPPGKLPANLPGQPTYRKINPADAPIVILALTCEHLRQGENVRHCRFDPRPETCPGARRRAGQLSVAGRCRRYVSM